MSSQAEMTSAGERTEAAFTPGARPPRVQVLGTRLGRYVEFEYAVDKDLAVELVMPFAAFDEFCATQGAEVCGAPDLSMDDLHVLAARRPGLYRAPQALAESEAS